MQDYITYIDTDSCGGNTEIITEKGIKIIEDLFKDGKELKVDNQGREFVKTNEKVLGYKDGLFFGKVNYVMRHKVKKNMYKVRYRNKEVIITEDHSIVIKRDEELISCTPLDIKEKDKIIFLF